MKLDIDLFPRGPQEGYGPDRIDQLFGLATPLNPPVYSTHQPVEGNATSTLQEDVDSPSPRVQGRDSRKGRSGGGGELG